MQWQNSMEKKCQRLWTSTVCNTLGINRIELAEKLGLSKTTIDAWSDKSRISKTAQVALELMLENHKLRSIIKNFQDGFTLLNSYNLEGNINTSPVNNQWWSILNVDANFSKKSKSG